MKKLLIFACIIITTLGCTKKQRSEFDPAASYDTYLQQANGSTVTFYGWGGDEQRNQWLAGEFTPFLKDKYNIRLEVVGMDIDTILAKLTGEKQAGVTGTIDMIWINGENFYSAKENGLLYGPFTHKLPNMKYIDTDDPETNFDFGQPIEGYEVPYGKAQLVFINNSSVTPEQPANVTELMAYVKEYPGKVTYPALPDFTGSAFVRNIIYDVVGHEQFVAMSADKEAVRVAIEPALSYLRQLNPYLWNQGKSFPPTSTALSNMFADGEIYLAMSYQPYTALVNVEKGIYPESAVTFLFDKGTIGNTNYLAIASNAPNKAGAIVAINEMISAQMQVAQFEKLKVLPVVDYLKLSDVEKAMFDAVPLGISAIPQNILLSKRLPEMPAKLVPLIEEIWLEEVVGRE